MEQLGPFKSIEEQLLFVRSLAQDFPDADPDELAGDPPPAAVVTKALKWAGREALLLRAEAHADNLEGFLETFAMFRKRLRAINYFAVRLRYRWAVAVRKGLEIAEIEHRGRKHASAHMALFEWCREVLFTTWCAACPEKFYSVCQGAPVDLDVAEVRDNWTSVRRLLDAMDFLNPEEFHPQIDAELGAILEREPTRFNGEQKSPHEKLREDRDRQIYEARKNGRVWEAIVRDWRDHPDVPLRSISGVKSAVRAYAKRVGLPELPGGKGGRTKKADN
jgi:hypothetical protein